MSFARAALSLARAGTSSRALSSSTVRARLLAGRVDLGLDLVGVVRLGRGHGATACRAVVEVGPDAGDRLVGSGGAAFWTSLLPSSARTPATAKSTTDEIPASQAGSSARPRIAGDERAQAEKRDETGPAEQAGADAQALASGHLGLSQPDLVADQPGDLLAELPDQLPGGGGRRVGGAVSALVAPAVGCGDVIGPPDPLDERPCPAAAGVTSGGSHSANGG